MRFLYFVLIIHLFVFTQCSGEKNKPPLKYNCIDFQTSFSEDPRFGLALDAYKTGDYNGALITFKDLLKDSQAEDNLLQTLLVKENLGLLYLKIKKNKNAEMEFDEVRKLNLELNNLRFKAVNLECFGRLARVNKQYKKSNELFEQSMDIYLHCKELYRLNSNLNHIAFNYFYLKDLENSRDYLIKALKLSKKLKSKENESLSLFLYGKILIEEKKLEKAKKIFFQLLELDKELKHSANIARDLAHIALVYNLLGRKAKELHYYERAYAVLKSSSVENSSIQMIDILKSIISLYKLINDKAQADFFQNELTEIYKKK